MAAHQIKYIFEIPGAEKEVFDIRLDQDTLSQVNTHEDTEHADWVRLDNHQCDHCPLTLKDHQYCPVAQCLERILQRFGNIASHDELVVKVITEDRTVGRKTTAQRALSSLMGLMIATSGCPKTLFFRAMARFHQPLCSSEETICRAAAMYLLSEYFRCDNAADFDSALEGLTQIYKDMSIINNSLAMRLREAFSNDSSVNAVILLDVYAKAMPYVVEEALEEVRYLFVPYLDSLTATP